MQTVLTPELRYEIRELIDERIRENHVTKEDFTELKDIVKELAKEQKETQKEIKELAREQKRTESKVGELAEAQKQTESRMEELVEAQKQTESRMEELAKAQKEAQEEIKVLALTLKDTRSELKDELKYIRRDLGDITSTLGFMLENEAYRVLPGIVKDKYGIEVKERFLRRSIRSLGINEEGEINIFSRGVDKDKGTEVVIIGEAKSQLEKDDIDDLLELSARLKEIDKGEIFLLAVTHYARERVIEYAGEKGVEVIQSFEW